MDLALVPLLWFAKLDTTSLARREREPDRGDAGGARRDWAAATGGESSDSGVSQNM